MKKNIFLRKSAQDQAAADYLYFQATGASTIALVAVGSPAPISMSYSTNGRSWLSYTIGTTLNIADGDKVYFRASRANLSFSQSASNYYKFQGTGSFISGGDILSLLSRNISICSLTAYCFANLFSGLTALKAPPYINGRAILSNYSLYRMFYGSGITTAMQLPFMGLANNCYREMFSHCAALTTAPTLPSLTAKENCYREMFSHCTALLNPPTILAQADAEGWLMKTFQNCSNLLTAPEIRVQTLTGWDGLYQTFYNCTRLSFIRVNFTNWYRVGQWVYGVAANGIFECPTDLPQEFSVDGIPPGWTVNTF